MTLARLRHMRERRKALAEQVNAFADFETWKETCVPSYCHPNLAAAYVSWRRLFAAIDLANAHTGWGPVLDFGASGVAARWFALDILSNYGDNYTGLGELRFYPLPPSQVAIPEPTSTTVLLGGLLALLAGRARRRRQSERGSREA